MWCERLTGVKWDGEWWWVRAEEELKKVGEGAAMAEMRTATSTLFVVC